MEAFECVTKVDEEKKNKKDKQKTQHHHHHTQNTPTLSPLQFNPIPLSLGQDLVFLNQVSLRSIPPQIPQFSIFVQYL